jgi:hypothetical protein
MDLQRDASKQAGCGQFFTDTIGGVADRPGRPLKHLIETIRALHERDVGFRSLTENIDTTTSAGKLVFHIFGALGLV